MKTDTTMTRRTDPDSAEAPVGRLRFEVDRLFDDFFRGWEPFGVGHLPSLAHERFVPTLDITESDKEFRVSMELPGMAEDDVQLSLSRNVLTVRGEKKTEERSDEDQVHRVECRYGRFERSLQLPADVDAEQVKARFKKGVLKIVLPKTERVQARKIQVKS
ncbi:MAG TPA: Hsp20/alpha crystallin family protein [Planctomycetota bacterium]